MDKPIHVGLMIPSNNTTMERELLAWLPVGSTCTTVKIPRGEGMLTRETLPAYVDRGISLAQTFSKGDFDVVAYGCTAASFLAGAEGDAEVAAAIAKASGRPVVTTARSMVIALKALNVQNIAIVTPYQEAVNVRLIHFLLSEKIYVQKLSSFNAATVDELASITSAAVAELALTVMDQECEALFIACSQLPTFDILDSLQQSLQKPVLSSIQVTAQQVLITAAL